MDGIDGVEELTDNEPREEDNRTDQEKMDQREAELAADRAEHDRQTNRGGGANVNVD